MVQSPIVVAANFTGVAEEGQQAVLTSQAEKLASRLQLPLADISPDASQESVIILQVSNSGLALRLTGKLAPGPVTVDFAAPTLRYRLDDAVRSQAIARAVGVRPGLSLTVLDATAGLGKDAFLLGSLGCKVKMYERNAIVHALLEDGLRRGQQSDDKRLKETIARLTLELIDYTQCADDESVFDVVYLDPMFPKRSKSARVKKDLFVLQRLLAIESNDSDDWSLLEPALAKALKRVVVKRSKTASYLANRQPSFSMPGKTSRYDVYVTG